MLERHFIILDEPFSGLDPVNINNVIKLIYHIAHEHTLNTFIIITHDVTSALMISDRVYLIGRERNAQGEPQNGSRVMKDYDLIAEGIAYQRDITDIEEMPRFAALRKEIKLSNFRNCNGYFMADEEINYVKEVLGSNWNLAFVGVMLFGMLVVNPLAFLPLLLAGEIGALFIAQNPRVQRIIRADKNKDQQIEVVAAETEIVRTLPTHYQNDFQFVRHLCEEIEKRSGELNDAGANALLAGTLEKLAGFRMDYARMLRAHHSLSCFIPTLHRV